MVGIHFGVGGRSVGVLQAGGRWSEGVGACFWRQHDVQLCVLVAEVTDGRGQKR